MKSRDSLIRLKRFHADEKRRQVAQMEAMIAEFERMAKELDDQVLAEQERSGIHDAGHFAYPTFAKAAMQRRDNLTGIGLLVVDIVQCVGRIIMIRPALKRTEESRAVGINAPRQGLVG